ncbi:hypothetical protein PV327_007540 [Microctonus hyperodae]|uniref:RING-type domain-containing protein n=1 Tax=Microctonus hyperodae TaxID=165561 RepID=A0AA39G0P3_MICHY|nr:hypothetical protein PV327_007540 [Microctonus hyperodae]
MYSHPAFSAAMFALGAIISAGFFIYKQYQQQSRNNQDEYHSNQNRNQNDNQQNRNITCPFCSCYVAKGDYKLDCGHICHKSCHDDRPVRERYCRFCRNGNENNDKVPDPVNYSAASTSRRRNGESSSKNCCYCDIPMNEEDILKMNCGHSGHKHCVESFNKFMNVCYKFL